MNPDYSKKHQQKKMINNRKSKRRLRKFSSKNKLTTKGLRK